VSKNLLDAEFDAGVDFERSRIIKLLEAKQLGCDCGCGHWMNAEPVIALIKGENK
jgi:hypothetical protein